MKKKITLLCIILFCFVSQGRAQTVGFEYDDDGNMNLRHILTMSKQNTKDIIEAPKPVTEEIGEQKITIYPVPTRGLFQVAVTLLDSKKKNYFSLYSLAMNLRKLIFPTIPQGLICWMFIWVKKYQDGK